MGRGGRGGSEIGRAEEFINADSDLDPHPRWHPGTRRAMTPYRQRQRNDDARPRFPSFTQFLGVNVLHRSPERTEAELTVREELCNRPRDSAGARDR